MNSNRVHVGQKVVILAGPDLGRTAKVVSKHSGICLLDVNRPERSRRGVNNNFWDAMLRLAISDLVAPGREAVIHQRVLMPVPDEARTNGRFYLRGNALYAMDTRVKNGVCLMWMMISGWGPGINSGRWALAWMNDDGEPTTLIDDHGRPPVPLVKATTADMTALAAESLKDRLVGKIISSPLHDLDIEVLREFCDAIDEL